MRLLAIGITVSPPLAVPVLSGPVVMIVVVMVRAPVAITLPGVVDVPLPATLRLPVPVGTIVRRHTIPVRATVRIPGVPSVPKVITVTFSTPVSVVSLPVVSLPVSAPVRVQSVSLPVSGSLSFIASRTGLGLVLLLSICASFSAC